MNWKKWLVGIGIAMVLLLAAGFATYKITMQDPEFGAEATDERLKRMQGSSQYDLDHFANRPANIDYDLMVNWEDFMGDQQRVPPAAFPAEIPALRDKADDGLRAYWLGHATVLIELEGHWILTDPMLTDQAFPIEMMAPKRLNPSPVPLDKLPPIDIAVISHDHYDHLDMETVQHLAKTGTQLFVGLGVGAHLELWGIPKEQIHEMDWWESKTYRGLTVHCTPARHYSGRRAMDNSTLWTSWLVKGAKHTIYHSGDSGYAGHFAEIGERLGPIDLSLIKIGDYGLDLGWQDIHMIPENSIQAHLDIKAKVLLPIHWGTFQLSNHDWDEPIERAMAAAEKKKINMITPKLGQRYTHGEEFTSTRWWKALSSLPK